MAAAPLEELEDELLDELELELELDEEELLERPELEEELLEEDEDELEDELAGGSPAPPPQAKSAVADTSTPASFMVRIASDSDCVVNIICYLVGISMTALNIEIWSAA